MRGKPTWEHLDDELHVLLQCEDTPNRAKVKLASAMRHVKRMLVPVVSSLKCQGCESDPSATPENFLDFGRRGTFQKKGHLGVYFFFTLYRQKILGFWG